MWTSYVSLSALFVANFEILHCSDVFAWRKKRCKPDS